MTARTVLQGAERTLGLDLGARTLLAGRVVPGRGVDLIGAAQLHWATLTPEKWSAGLELYTRLTGLNLPPALIVHALWLDGTLAALAPVWWAGEVPLLLQPALDLAREDAAVLLQGLLDRALRLPDLQPERAGFWPPLALAAVSGEAARVWQGCGFQVISPR